MKVALFIPCYVQAVFPAVADASRRLLADLGIDAEEPKGQTCCGQPMGNAGFENEARSLAHHFERLFADYDYVVGPSASCVTFVRDHYDRLLGRTKPVGENRVYELCEFVHDIVRPTSLHARFPHRVSLQNSCHGVRLMNLSAPSELNIPYFSKLRDLLALVKDVDVVEPERPDECCGFGGMFSIEETAVSASMGLDKVHRHIKTGAEFIAGADCSCLMHQGGIIAREHLPIRTIHIAQILTAREGLN